MRMATVGVVGAFLGACIPLVLLSTRVWNVVSVILCMFLGAMVAVAVWKELP
jgi:uncharacterized membrane protein YeaQ/YmgE (transglycosylase-associated protein family)